MGKGFLSGGNENVLALGVMVYNLVNILTTTRFMHTRVNLMVFELSTKSIN